MSRRPAPFRNVHGGNHDYRLIVDEDGWDCSRCGDFIGRLEAYDNTRVTWCRGRKLDGSERFEFKRGMSMPDPSNRRFP